MITGLGVDIVEIDRIQAAVKQYGDSFLNRIFTSGEISYCTKRRSFKFPELAARFAAKEAYAKAVGTGMRGIHWKEIEVVNEKTGKPRIAISGKIRQNVLVTLSHSLTYSVACVVIDGTSKKRKK